MDDASRAAFREKLRSLSFSTGARRVKQTVDVHDRHEVVVTEHSGPGDRVDVAVRPPTVHATRSR